MKSHRHAQPGESAPEIELPNFDNVVGVDKNYT